ncbi:MAG: ankyrin repeat domain-containing protein [Brevinematales bacterium]|nr:ankyrin repeat domain-containing protein [Brevinematales bacterium]
MKRILSFGVYFFLLWGYTRIHGDVNRELLLAISQKNFETVQHLIENKKASVFFRDVNKRTPLHWAVIAGDLKIVAYLIYKGADIEAREKNGATPLHFVAYSKNLDIVKYLIQNKAEINATDYAGWTPLHYYTYYQFEMGVKYLIYTDADLEARTTKPSMGIPAGATALDIAIKINKQAYIDALSNPQIYQNIANRPRLALEVIPKLSFSNILFAEEKGNLSFLVKNTGEGPSQTTFLEFSSITNQWFFLSTNFSPQMVESGRMYTWTAEIIGLTPPRDTEVYFRVRAIDLDSKRSSEWQEVRFWIWSNRPPSLVLGATMMGSANVLRPMMGTSLLLTLSNEGLGPLKNALLTLQDTKGYVVPVRIGPLFLPRQSSTNLLLFLQTGENVEDGETTLEIQISSPFLNRFLTFSRILPTKGYLPPQLSFSPSLYRRLSLTIITNTVQLETGATTETLTTNSSLLVYPMLEIVNTGERPATNLSLEIRIPTETNTFLYTYAIPLLATGEKRSLAIPIERRLLPGYLIFLKATDGVTTYLSTNLPSHFWPEE